MTPRQFYLILFTIVISLKIQKMPCLVYEFFGKDSYFFIFLYFLIEIILIIIAHFIAKYLSKCEKNSKNNCIFGFISKIIALFVASYFLIVSILYYEAIQDLFSHILFDHLSWSLFSIFFIISIFFLAYTGFENIGRFCEIVFPVTLFSLIILAIFGGFSADFTNIFPINSIFNNDYFLGFEKFGIWFGDFLFVIFLKKNAGETKLWKTILTYTLSMFLVILFVIEFEGIYGSFSSLQPSLISTISEQILLGVDIGRWDWFLILGSEIGTVVGAGICLCISKKQIGKIMPKISENLFLVILSAMVYFIDIIYLVDLNKKKLFFLSYVAKASILVQVAVLIFSIIYIIKSKKRKYKPERAEI